MSATAFANPFRPGAGHAPPYLAGRDEEQREFRRHLQQRTVLTNLLLTGLRGVGKTVLMSSMRPIALREGWFWAGADLSESASVSESTIATRIITDLSVVTSSIVLAESRQQSFGFLNREEKSTSPIDYPHLFQVYERAPGLISDKIKATLLYAWNYLAKVNVRGVVFAYDEAQNMSDQRQRDQYPLSVLLDVFQSLQRQNVPFLLLLTGLPTLLTRLVDTRTYTERMFHNIEIGRLDERASREAIMKPIEMADCPVKFLPTAVQDIYNKSGGYPYFIQFICREAFDAYLQIHAQGQNSIVQLDAILKKLDTDFFAGRWDPVTDRQRQLLGVISMLDNCDDEFTVQQIAAKSKEALPKSFSASHVNQMLSSLISSGLIYKNRHGRYMFAVPLLHQFIRRQIEEGVLPTSLS